MRRVVLNFSVGRFLLDADAEIAEPLKVLFPAAAAEGPEDGPFLRRFRIGPIDPGEDAQGRLSRRWALQSEGDRCGEFEGPAQVLLALEYEIEQDVLAARGDHIALHAGAVEVDGQGWAIAGPAEAGKSSSTFQLLELGHGFLGDEVTLVDPASGDILPFLRTLGLEGGVVNEFLSAFAVQQGELIELLPAIWRYKPRRVIRQRIPLVGIILPRYQPGKPGEVVEVSASDVLVEVLGYCFEPRVDEEVFFEQVMRLLTECRVYRVSYGHAEEARQLYAGLLPAR